MKKHIDLFSFAVILCMFGVYGLPAFIYSFKTEKNSLIYSSLFSLFLALVGVIILVILKYKSGSGNVVENSSEIIIKPEKSDSAVSIPVNSSDIKADGIGTKKYTDKLYKIHNGMNVTIDENGEVKPVNFISGLFAPGWKTQSEFHADSVKNWDATFNLLKNTNLK